MHLNHFLLSALFLFTGSIIAADNQSITAQSEKKLKNVWTGNATAGIPTATRIPVIDGIESENEWSDALQLNGFHANLLLVPHQQGYVLVKHDAENIYFLVRTTTPDNDPGGGLRTYISERDGAVYNDDSVEFTFSTPELSEKAYHLIFNANNALFDEMLVKKVSNQKWNIRNYSVESRARSGWWVLEARFPLKEIGGTAEGIRFNVARNWHGFGPSAVNMTRIHTNIQKMFLGIFAPAVPLIRLRSLGAPESSQWKIDFDVSNSLNKKLILAVRLRNYSWPKINGKFHRVEKIDFTEEREIAAGQSSRFQWEQKVNRHGRWLTISLYEPDTGKAWYSQLIRGQRMLLFGRQPITGKMSVPGTGEGCYRHYPGTKTAVFEFFDMTKDSCGKLELQLNSRKYKAVYADQKLIFRIPLADGANTVSYITRKNGQIDRQGKLCTILQKTYPWQNKNLGKERILLPPFVPIRADGRNSFSTLYCRYDFQSSGLPRSVKAEGRELLAAPAYMEMVVDGRKITFSDRGKVSMKVASDGLDARLNGEEKHRGIRLQSGISSEYDNFNHHRLSISGLKGKQISRWTLYFPLKDSEARLFHTASNLIPLSPGGTIPPQQGLVWDGSKLPRRSFLDQEIMHPAFVPYIWLGGEKRGLSWFANTSFGMKLDLRKTAVRLIRSKGRVTLEIDLINRLVSLKDGHYVEFGTQATPVKPIDQRLLKMTFDSYGQGTPKCPNAIMISTHVLGYPFNWTKTAANDDYSLMDTFVNAAATGKTLPFTDIFNEYMKKNNEEIRRMYRKVLASDPERKPLDIYEQQRNNFLAINFGKHPRKPSLPYKYSDPRLVYTPEAVAEYFKCEWFNPAIQGYFGGMRTSLTPSLIDYLLYSYDLEFRHGMKGCYLDDTYLMPETNPFTMGKVDDEGIVHPDIGIYAMRELIRRIAVMQHLRGQSPRMLQVHMTHTQIVPAFSFATSQLSWEANFGEKPLQQRYSTDGILTESTGLQTGNAPLALGGIIRRTTPRENWPKKFDFLTRTLLAMTLPHGVGIWLRASPNDASRKVVLAAWNCLGNFGISAPDCVFQPFFDADRAPGEITGRDLMISAYARPDKKLMVIGNRTGEPREFSIRGKYSSIRDAETGSSLQNHTVPPYDFRLIELMKQ